MRRVVLSLSAWSLLACAAFAQAPPPDATCPARLAQISDAAIVPPPESDDEGCVISTPVRIGAIEVEGGKVKLSGAPVLDCPFALQVARWTRDVAAPLAKGELDRELVELGTGNGFQCRRRNRKKTGKLSEHAFGNAIDIVAFRFAESRFDVEDYEDMDADEAGYLDAVRKSACGYFTTILGPGTNAAHANHLHFDLGRTYKDGKRRENPYRICD